MADPDPVVLLFRALEKAEGRLAGIIEAADEGRLADVALTTAGTDVDGLALTDAIGEYANTIVGKLAEAIEGRRADAPELSGLLRDFTYRCVNGAAVVWFWAGWEVRANLHSEAPPHEEMHRQAIALLHEWSKGEDPVLPALGYRTGEFLRALEDLPRPGA